MKMLQVLIKNIKYFKPLQSRIQMTAINMERDDYKYPPYSST